MWQIWPGLCSVGVWVLPVPVLDPKADDILEGSTMQGCALDPRGFRSQQEKGIALYQAPTVGQCLCSMYYLLAEE